MEGGSAVISALVSGSRSPGFNPYLGEKFSYLNMIFLSELRFYCPVNPLGSCRTWSVYLTTLFLDRLNPLSDYLSTFFHQKVTTALPLLESTDGRNFMINLHERMSAGIKPVTS